MPTIAAHAARCELAEVERDRDRERRRDQERDERRDAVPKMNGSAPKTLLTGSQVVTVMKPRPKLANREPGDCDQLPDDRAEQTTAASAAASVIAVEPPRRRCGRGAGGAGLDAGVRTSERRSSEARPYCRARRRRAAVTSSSPDRHRPVAHSRPGSPRQASRASRHPTGSDDRGGDNLEQEELHASSRRSRCVAARCCGCSAGPAPGRRPQAGEPDRCGQLVRLAARLGVDPDRSTRRTASRSPTGRSAPAAASRRSRTARSTSARATRR